jgi:predicted nucleotidyltransferase
MYSMMYDIVSFQGLIVMKPSDVLQQNRALILEVVGRHRVANPRVFGSVLHGDDTETSDLDLLVDTVPGTSLFDLGGLQVELEDALGIPVQVVTPLELHPSFRDRVIAEAAKL